MQELLGLCEAENGTQVMSCCKPEQVGTKEHGKCWNEFRFSRTAEFLQKNWKKGQKKENHEKNVSEAFE